MKCILCESVAEYRGDFLVERGSRQRVVVMCKDHKIFLRAGSVEDISTYLAKELWREADKL